MKNRNKFEKEINSLDEERADLYKKSGWVLPLVFIIPIVLFVSVCMAVPEMSMLFGGLFLIVAALTYTFSISAPFKRLKYKVREYLLKEFMEIYHPNISYHYQPEKNQVKQIIKTSKLVNCNEYHEEDVITGTANNINFYLSEIKLQQSSGKSTSTVFQGILFKIKIPGRNFPSAQIQSKPGLLKKVFGNFVQKKLFGFWYDTLEHEKFEQELGPLFPFIRYLIQQQKDIRISTKDNEITILMKSDIKFLDDPKPQLNRSFKDETYYQKIGQQINSLLFIVEAFAGKLDKQEVIERLELKELEYRQLGLEENNE